MAEDKELSQLESITNPSANDLIYIVSGGNSKKIPYGSAFPKDDYYTKAQTDTALAGKEPTISVTANRALVSDANGKVSASSVTDTEVGYLSGVTSAIQGQIDAKADESELDATPVQMTGNPITITDAANIPCESLSMTIEPVQTGSGTPSPSNIRPITGLTEATIFNGIDVWTGSDSYSISIPNYLFAFGILPSVIELGNYELQFTCENPSGVLQFIINKNTTSGEKLVDITKNCESINKFDFEINQTSGSYIFRLYSNATNGITISNVKLVKKSNTATITFGETVYGGSVDFNAGTVTVTHGFYTLDGNETWTVENGRRVMSTNVTNVKGAKDNASVPNLISSQFDAITPNGTWWGTTGVSVSTGGAILIAYEDYTKNADTWKSYLAQNPLQICYELATPRILTLTPAQLELLKGYNTVSANGATITLDYQKDNLVGDLKKWVLDHISA